LEVVVELRHLTRSDLLQIRKRQDQTIWRWFEFFPVEDRSAIVSLGEGYTPLVEPSRLREKLGLHRLYLKNDTVLPTGSLKDRTNAVGLSKARELGFETVAVASTGNGAASVAGYAAAAGLRSVIMVPIGTSSSKVVQAHAYGATIVVLDGDFGQVVRLYREAVKEFAWYDCLLGPYQNEGKKSYAYELFDQLGDQVPDWIIHPTAGGRGLYATWKGYKELLKLGWINRLPRLVAAQSEAAAPIATSFEKGLADIEPVTPRHTIAESIRVGNPAASGRLALEAMRSSQGAAVALSDDEILEAQSLLARLAGIFAEPAAAVSVAAACRLRQQGMVGKEDLVVCMITGHGLKQPSAIRISDAELRAVAPDLSALQKRLKEVGSL
jgi:threonine synthase